MLRALKVCPGCRRTLTRAPFCPPCGRERREHSRGPEQLRQLYRSKRWRDERAWFLHENPLCAEHQRVGKVVQANTVDHVEPHRGNVATFWDRGNWQALCKDCHDVKTFREIADRRRKK